MPDPAQDVTAPAIPGQTTPPPVPVEAAPATPPVAVAPASMTADPVIDLRVKEAEQRASTAEQDALTLRRIINEVPGLRDQALNFYETGGTTPPAPVTDPPPPPSDEPIDPREVVGKMKREMEAEQAVRDWTLRLGQGDPLKGKEVFDAQYEPHAQKIIKVMNSGRPSERLNLAMRMIQLEKTISAPPVPPPPPGVTVTETGRAGTTAAPAPKGTAMNDEALLAEALEEIGFVGPTARFDYSKSLVGK